MCDKDLSIKFITEFLDGNVWGVYYDGDGDLTCETKDGKVFYLYGNDIAKSEDGNVIFDTSDIDWSVYPENHAYLVTETGIEKLDLDSNSADGGSGVRYYQGKEGALVTWEDSDGTENPERSGFYETDSFLEFNECYL